jgi:hypothetical protein
MSGTLPPISGHPNVTGLGPEMIRWQIPPASPEMFCPRCGRRLNLVNRAVTPGDRRRARAALTH